MPDHSRKKLWLSLAGHIDSSVSVVGWALLPWHKPPEVVRKFRRSIEVTFPKQHVAFFASALVEYATFDSLPQSGEYS